MVQNYNWEIASACLLCGLKTNWIVSLALETNLNKTIFQTIT